MNTPASRLYSPDFMLLCLSHALFAGSFNMMLPELPAYLTNMGGSEYKGYIIALFTLTAGLSRPFSGKLTDSIGRMPVMYVGVWACVVCSTLYPWMAFVGGFLALRFFHGFSTGFKPTATAAYVADVVPPQRRGEAMGILGVCLSVGGSGAPVLGSWLVKNYGIQVMFYVSAFVAALSMLVLTNLRETLENRQRFHWSLLKVNKTDVFDPAAIPAAIIMLFTYFSYGVILTLAPDLSDQLGVPNRGVFFALFTLASISTRLFAGKISDQVGRVPVMKVSSVVVALSMFAFASARHPYMLYVASVLFGLGNGIFSPAINAWTVDLGHPEQKGRALATMFIALEIAIGGGALISGWYCGDEIARMPAMFAAAGLASLFGWVYLSFGWKPTTAQT